MADVVRVLTNNLKLAAVGIGAAALFGGTATTVALVDNETPSPNPKASEKAKKDKPTPKASKAAEDAKAEDAGSRPTDTHGYCVSQAVAAAHAAGKTGQDVAAAAHSCKAEKDAEKAAKKAAKAAQKAARDAGKSAQAPGRSGS